MPKFKSSRPVLDQGRPIEMILDLLSFAGGENTISEDAEMKSNEARIIENWDALSLGGMVRSKGFNEVASVLNADDYDVALIHFDGVDAAVAAVETVSGATITFVGTAALDTAQKAFGLSSLLLDGNSDSVTLADSSNWNFGTGNFTCNLRLRLAVDQDCVLMGQYVDANNFWYIKYDQVGSLLTFIHKDDGTVRADYDVAWNPVINTWYDIEVSRSTIIMQMFIDGTKQTLTENTAASTNDFGDIAAVLEIGAQNAGDYVDGWIDEVRISKGVARHTATFTKPVVAFVANGPFDMLLHHLEGVSTTQLFGIIKGDLVFKNSAVVDLADASGFTTGVLSAAVSAGDKLWITNATDNLKYKTIAGVLTVPASKPTLARERIHFHKFRLLAEGGGKRVYGSRAGTGNWTAANAWSLANDAWNTDLPDLTRGAVPDFPSGNEVAVFTDFGAYSLFNFPDIAYRFIPNSRGCAVPESIAVGKEGVFFLSNYPTLGIFLWDKVNWIDLTRLSDFINEIDITKRVFGSYRNDQYYITYVKTGSGVTVPNTTKIYNTEFGRWMTRPVNTAISDNFGIIKTLRYDNNELYASSSQKGKIYELETTDNSDEDNNTEATYRTKDFSSRDFAIVGGDQFPVDLVRFKLLKVIATFFGTTGSFSINWNMDKGKYTGSQTFTLSASGAKINDDFEVNTSSIIASTSLPESTVFKSFSNSAIGRTVRFEIINNATGERLKIRRLKIHAVAFDEL